MNVRRSRTAIRSVRLVQCFALMIFALFACVITAERHGALPMFLCCTLATMGSIIGIASFIIYERRQTMTWGASMSMAVSGLLLLAAGVLGGAYVVPQGDDPWVSMWFACGLIGSILAVLGIVFTTGGSNHGE